MQALYYDPTTALLYGLTSVEPEADSLTVTATQYPDLRPTGPGLPLFPGVSFDSSDAAVSVRARDGQRVWWLGVCSRVVCVCHRHDAIEQRCSNSWSGMLFQNMFCVPRPLFCADSGHSGRQQPCLCLGMRCR